MSAEIPSWLARKVAFEGRYASIPECTKYSLKMWVLYGQTPGGFVEAVLRNDLHGAFNNADSDNLAALELIMGWIHNECPGDCWLAPGNYPAPAEESTPHWARRTALMEHISGITPMPVEDALEIFYALTSEDTASYRDAARKQLYQFGGLIAEEVPA